MDVQRSRKPASSLPPTPTDRAAIIGGRGARTAVATIKRKGERERGRGEMRVLPYVKLL
jgi:hypothetical protein